MEYTGCCDVPGCNLVYLWVYVLVFNGVYWCNVHKCNGVYWCDVLRCNGVH